MAFPLSLQTDSTETEPKKTYTSRKDRPTHSLHFGDTDFPTNPTEEDIGDATWAEVCNACCVHTGEEWAWIVCGICGVVFFLYFFLFALDLLGNGAKVMTGCSAGELFGDETNPVAGVMIGILATVLLQSSSTTTSIVVSLTGSAITVSQGIYMSKFIFTILLWLGRSISLTHILRSLILQSWELTLEHRKFALAC